MTTPATSPPAVVVRLPVALVSLFPGSARRVELVQGGIVEACEAYRSAVDHPGFLAQLERQGIDTSFVERLA